MRSKVKRLQQFVKITSRLWEITCNMGSHSVSWHQAAVTFPPLPQQKQVMDLATPEGCKAELTCVAVIPQDRLPTKASHLSRAVQWLGSEPATKSRKSDVLTTKPPSHLSMIHNYTALNSSDNFPFFPVVWSKIWNWVCSQKWRWVWAMGEVP